MTPRLGEAVQTAWTALVIGAFALIFRREVMAVLRKAQSDMEARRVEVAAETERIARGQAYLATIRDKIVAEEHDA